MKLDPLLVFALFGAAATLRAEIVVRVGPGALPTLTSARDALRAARGAGQSGPFRILVDGGVHPIGEPLVLEPRDSGTPQEPVIFEAAPPGVAAISGGVVLDLVREEAGDLRVYRLPGGLAPESVWIGPHRAIPARHPNSGFYRLAGVEAGEATNQIARVRLQAPPGAFVKLAAASPESLPGVRIVALHKWDFTRWRLDSIDPLQGAMAATANAMKPWNPLKSGSRFWFENHASFLDAAGEWFAAGDELRVVWPAAMDRATPVVAAVHSRLVSIEGTAENPVHDIVFRGLNFQHSAASPPQHEPRQASVYAPAMIEANHAQRIVFDGCEVSHTGGHGLWLRADVRECRVTDSLFADLGGGGVYLGRADHKIPDSAQPAVSNRVENCVITHGGRHYFSSVGILVGHGSDNILEHNHVSDFFYSGFSVGWVWGYGESVAKRNRIAHNRVQHLGHGLLCDLGGIYTLGKSEGTVVTGNIFHDIHCYEYGGWGLYTDEGSSGILFENNLVADTSTGGFHQHYGRENIVRNNLFANARHWQLQATRVEDHLSFTFENNLVLWKEGDVLGGRWREVRALTRSNLYWKVGAGDVRFAGMTLEAWQAAGHETGSVIADPRLDDVPDGRVDPLPGSPALAVGFKACDWSAAGTRPGPGPLWGLKNIPPRLHPQATGFRFGE